MEGAQRKIVFASCDKFIQQPVRHTDAYVHMSKDTHVEKQAVHEPCKRIKEITLDGRD